MKADPYLHQYCGIKTGLISLESLRSRRDESLPLFFSQLQVFRNKNSSTHSHGQGLNFNESLHACMGESLERQAALQKPFNSNMIFGSINELKSKFNFLPLEYYQNFSHNQLIEQGSIRNLESDEQCLWIEGQMEKSVEKSKVLFPFSSISMSVIDHPYSGPPNTSGIAIGRSQEIANCIASMEAAERSALLKHWWHQTAPPHIDLDEVNNIALHPMVMDLVTLLGERLHILNLTGDTGLPTFISVILGNKKLNEPAVIIGSACKGTLQEAITKSLLEAFNTFNDVSRIIKRTGPPAKKAGAGNIEGGLDRILYYSRYENLDAFLPLLNGKNDALSNFEQVFSIDPEPCKIMKILKEKLGKIILFDLTPLDLSMGGLYLTRAVLPDQIPLESVHGLRPLGCVSLKEFSGHLNDNPHPIG